MSPEFIENLFICGIIVCVLLAGYGIISLLGLMIVKVWDRARRKHRWYCVRRVL